VNSVVILTDLTHKLKAKVPIVIVKRRICEFLHAFKTEPYMHRTVEELNRFQAVEFV